MCIAVPAQIISLGDLTAIVDFGGIRQEVNTALIDNIQTGDYLLVHCACAIEKLNLKEAERVIHLLETGTGKFNGGKER